MQAGTQATKSHSNNRNPTHNSQKYGYPQKIKNRLTKIKKAGMHNGYGRITDKEGTTQYFKKNIKTVKLCANKTSKPLKNHKKDNPCQIPMKTRQ